MLGSVEIHEVWVTGEINGGSFFSESRGIFGGLRKPLKQLRLNSLLCQLLEVHPPGIFNGLSALRDNNVRRTYNARSP